MGKIGQIQKLGNFDARSSATVRRTEKLIDLWNSLALGLQCGANTISLQCIPWPVACSEWGACLTDFRFQILGENDPWSKNFWKWIPWRDTEIRFVIKFDENRPLRSCWKVAWFTKQKNSRSAGLVPAPILPKMGRSRPKFPERCHPLIVHVGDRIWSGSAAFCLTYSGKIDFSAQKVNTI